MTLLIKSHAKSQILKILNTLFLRRYKALVYNGPMATGLMLGRVEPQAKQGKPKLVLANQLSASELKKHEAHMARALELARNASGAPFGAVIVDRQTDRIVSEGSNRGKENPIFHGEIVALMNCQRLSSGAKDLTLYTSCEPCPMCAGAIAWAGIDQVVYATSLKTLTKMGVGQIHIDTETLARAAPDFPLGKGLILGGVLAKEADPIYQKWAKELGVLK